MKRFICEENRASEEKLPPNVEDNSGIGVYYIDAYIKPMNRTLEDGTQLTCKRRGLKLTLRVGEKEGSGLMRRLDYGPDPRAMLRVALKEAASAAGYNLLIENGALCLEKAPSA